MFRFTAHFMSYCRQSVNVTNKSVWFVFSMLKDIVFPINFVFLLYINFYIMLLILRHIYIVMLTFYCQVSVLMCQV